MVFKARLTSAGNVLKLYWSKLLPHATFYILKEIPLHVWYSLGNLATTKAELRQDGTSVILASLCFPLSNLTSNQQLFFSDHTLGSTTKSNEFGHIYRTVATVSCQALLAHTVGQTQSSTYLTRFQDNKRIPTVKLFPLYMGNINWNIFLTHDDNITIWNKLFHTKNIQCTINDLVNKIN